MFDGVCNLCNGLVQRLIKLDKKNDLMYASLQSEFAKNLLSRFPEKPNDLNSVVLYENNKIYTEAEAIFKITKHLGTLHQILLIAKIFPKPFNNAIYRWVAKHRYGWFGKQETCMIPNEEQKHKFIL